MPTFLSLISPLSVRLLLSSCLCPLVLAHVYHCMFPTMQRLQTLSPYTAHEPLKPLSVGLWLNRGTNPGRHSADVCCDHWSRANRWQCLKRSSRGRRRPMSAGNARGIRDQPNCLSAASWKTTPGSSDIHGNDDLITLNCRRLRRRCLAEILDIKHLSLDQRSATTCIAKCNPLKPGA